MKKNRFALLLHMIRKGEPMQRSGLRGMVAAYCDLVGGA